MNDMLPEEQDPQFEELITLLRHADLNPSLIDPTEHSQILSQARVRLFPTDVETSVSEYTPVSELSKPNTLANKPQLRGKRLMHLANMLAAVLVVAALIGSAQLLFDPLSPLRQNHVGTGTPIGPVGAPTLIFYGTLANFEMQLELTPGPYFVGELLEVDLSITNHTHTNHLLKPEPNPTCPEILIMTTTSGGSPHASDVQRNWNGLPDLFNCSWPWSPSLVSGIRVSINQTITIKHYVQLTSSGHVTLAAQLAAVTVTGENGTKDYIIPAGMPLTSRQLLVNTLVPSDRQLSVKEQKTQVTVSGPPAVRDQLIGEWETACSQSGRGVSGPGSISGVTVIATPSPCIFRVTTLSVFYKRLWLAYVVGAPGYALVSGRVNLQ